jgi:hypothetical protein
MYSKCANDPSPLLIGDITNDILVNYADKYKPPPKKKPVILSPSAFDSHSDVNLKVPGYLPSIKDIPASKLHYLYPTAQLPNGKIRAGRAMHISFEPDRSNILPYAPVSEEFEDKQYKYIEDSNEYEGVIDEVLREEQNPKTGQAMQIDYVSNNMGTLSALNEYFTDDNIRTGVISGSKGSAYKYVLIITIISIIIVLVVLLLRSHIMG